jgi:hypothetical protein
MFRNLGLIFLLAAALVVLLIFKPWDSFKKDPPRFLDRLPHADLVGKSNVLDLSRSLSATLYHYKIPFREFLSQEFILGQGKSFGLDLQSPVYFFGNEQDWMLRDFGALVMVTDSSKINIGVEKIRKLQPSIRDTTIGNYKIYMHPEERTYMTYGSDWMLIYKGDRFIRTFYSVVNARLNEIDPKWRTFLNQSGEHHMEAMLSFDKLTERGVSQVGLHISNDTTGLTIHTNIEQIDSLSFSMKESGPSYPDQMFTKNSISIHLDIERLRNNPKDPLYNLLSDIGKRVSFPTKELLNAWDGDLAFRQGGIETITEKYIESELDEDFNVTEIEKSKQIKIKGFSVYLSLNEGGPHFLNRLIAKGIITRDDKRYRLLYSPPLKMNFTDTSLALHTSNYLPAMELDSISSLVYTHKKTAYEFYLDSTDAYTAYGRIRIPLDYIVKSNITE